ncbi:MAG TPA: hypothetical protein VFU97_13400 [Xanthobacteraceae bacterium]|nr:hypothetical protein [Xanthobacteraceae bacterium]
MRKQIYVAQFTNGIDRRSFPVLQPDIIFAAMAAQRWAPDVFKMRWNRVKDPSKLKIVILAPDGRRHEEPAQISSGW